MLPGSSSDLRQGGFAARSVLKPDPKRPEVIQIQGTPPDRGGDVRNLLDTRYGDQYTIAEGANDIVDADHEADRGRVDGRSRTATGDRDHPRSGSTSSG